MIADWWRAHALEVVVWAVLVGLCTVVWLAESVSNAWRERKQKKRDGLL